MYLNRLSVQFCSPHLFFNVLSNLGGIKQVKVEFKSPGTGTSVKMGQLAVMQGNQAQSQSCQKSKCRGHGGYRQ